MDLSKLNDRDLVDLHQATQGRIRQLGSRTEAWVHVHLAQTILEEFRNRKIWPGDLHLSVVATAPYLCDGCGDDIHEGGTCWEVAGGETRPGTIGYYAQICDGCFAYYRLMDAGMAP